MRELIAAGADVDAASRSGFTPIHEAACHGRDECLRLLIEAGANVNAASRSGFTPAHEAAKFDDSLNALIGAGGCLRSLLAAGANVDATDSLGRTPAHHATAVGADDNLRVLIEHGADLGKVDALGKTSMDYAKEHRLDACEKLIRAAFVRDEVAALASATEGHGKTVGARSRSL